MKNHQNWIKLITSVIFILLMLSLSCTKEDTYLDAPNENPDITGLKSAVDQTGPVCLEGFTRFEVYSVREKKYLFTGDVIYLSCIANLSFPAKNKLVFNFKEYMGEPIPANFYRETTIEGHISKAGQMKFFWTDAISDVVEHTGIKVHGPGVNKGDMFFQGSYDGETFYADLHLSGHQTQAATYPLYWKNPADPSILYEGPIKFKIWFELTVEEE